VRAAIFATHGPVSGPSRHPPPSQADLDIITPSHLTLTEHNLALAEAIACIAQVRARAKIYPQRESRLYVVAVVCITV